MGMEQDVLKLLDEGVQDTKWIAENKVMLKEKYDEQFIAVKNRKVMASGKNYDELLKGLVAQGISPTDVLVEFITKIVRIP